MQIYFSKRYHTVNHTTTSIRLQDYSMETHLAGWTKSSWKKAIKQGQILVNGAIGTTATWIKDGDQLEFVSDTKDSIPAYELKIPVLYEDDYLAIVQKPFGLITSGYGMRSLNHCLSFNLQIDQSTGYQPRAVHRLDQQTGGLILIAKTAVVSQQLTSYFQDRKIGKRYSALVHGTCPEEATVEEQIHGQDAKTKLKRIDSFSKNGENYSLLSLYPETGRKHQLRIHLQGMGTPIVGDKVYGYSGNAFRGKGLFLWADSLRFQHPILGIEISQELPFPPKFERALKYLRL